MKSRQIPFEYEDADLLCRAARIGIRALGQHEQRRAEIALKRLTAIKGNLKRPDDVILILVKENEILKQSLSELKQQLSPETWKNYTRSK